MNINKKSDIDKPLQDQSTYTGRLKHFAFITDYRMIFVNDQKLREAKQFCDNYKINSNCSIALIFTKVTNFCQKRLCTF